MPFQPRIPPHLRPFADLGQRRGRMRFLEEDEDAPPLPPPAAVAPKRRRIIEEPDDDDDYLAEPPPAAAAAPPPPPPVQPEPAQPHVDIDEVEAKHEADWLDDVEEEKTDNPDFCYLCTYAQTDEDADGTSYHSRLLRIVSDNYGNVTDKLVCEMVQKFYNEEIRPYLDREHQPVWTKESIFAHITEHNPSMAAMYQRPIQVITKVMRKMERNALFIMDGMVDREAMRLYLALIDRRTKLMEKLAGVRTGSGLT